MLTKIKISPESLNYDDNDENVAYLYRGYYIWKYTESHGGQHWRFGEAVLVAPNADMGETFEPYWDDRGPTKTRESRRDCVYSIDLMFEQGLVADPEDEKNVTLTVSLNEARTILASLNRRVCELESLGGPQCEELVEATKSLYQSIDGQVFCKS